MIPVIGDLAKDNLGVDAADLRRLRGKVKHFFHVAAVYDLTASAEDAADRERRGHAQRRAFRRGRSAPAASTT